MKGTLRGHDRSPQSVFTYTLQTEVGGLMVSRTVEMLLPINGDPRAAAQELRRGADDIERAMSDMERAVQQMQQAGTCAG